jgi:hypothetical protein
MNAIIWAFGGVIVSVVVVFVYVFISPAYKIGERFSLPIVVFSGLALLHLFVVFVAVRYVVCGIDAVMLLWAITARVVSIARRNGD